MVVKLDLTEEMIKSFNECTRKGNYEPFMKGNTGFIKDLIKNLKKVRFHKDETISCMVSGHLSFYLNYLTKWVPNNPNCVVYGVKSLEKQTPMLTECLKSSIARKDWKHFYSEYFRTADFMITEARKQGIFDLQIWYGSASYDTFEDRDFVAQSREQVEHFPPNPQEETDVRNNRGMIKYEGEEADKHREEQHLTDFHNNRPQQDLTYHSKGGVTTFTVSGDSLNEDQWLKNRNNRSLSGNAGRDVQEISYGQNHHNSQQYAPTPPDRSESIRQDSIQSPRHLEYNRSECTVFTPTTTDDGLGIRLRDEVSYKDPRFAHSTSNGNGLQSEHHIAVRNRNISENHGSSQSSYQFNSLRNPETPKEYVPAISAEAELRSILPVKTFDAPSANYDTSQQISKYSQDMDRSEFRPQNIHENTTPRKTESFRETSVCRDSPTLENSDFDRKLEELKFKNAIELEKKKEERKRKQKRFEEEFRKLKEESKQRFEMLIQCILAKHRFEIQEEKWMEWIRGCRDNVVRFLNRWNEYVDDIEREQRGFRRPDRVDLQSLQESNMHCLESIMAAYNMLQIEFEHLKHIESIYSDALFVRVLMKCIADVGQKLLEIYSMTENLVPDRSEFLNLQSKMNTLSPHLIYSTSQLRSICKTAYPSEYQNFVFPRIKQSLKIQEFY